MQMNKLIFGLILFPVVAFAGPQVLIDFEGVSGVVGSYYDTAPHDLNVVFSPSAETVNVGGNTAMTFSSGSGINMLSLYPIIKFFEFSYSLANNEAVSVSIRDQIGTTLASINLGSSSGEFGVFTPVGVIFSGEGRFVEFLGSPNNFRVDNIRYGIPEPTPLMLFGAGLVALGLAKRRVKA